MNAPACAETATTTAAWVPLATAAARPLAVLQLARPATATATGATAHKTKHYCRNPRCRSRLLEPVENEHRAFCTRGCFESFYLNRCRVCEKPLRRARPGSTRLYCRPPNKCASEAQKWPHVYAYRPYPQKTAASLKNAHFTGLGEGRFTDHRALHHWSWRFSEFEHELRDAAGTLLARLESNAGRHRLTYPRTTPILSWADLGEAKRRAESFALMAIPLAAVDPKLAARIERDNETPHPMGPPLNRPPLTSDAPSSDWRPTGNGAGVPDIPGFLRRRPVP